MDVERIVRTQLVTGSAEEVPRQLVEGESAHAFSLAVNTEARNGAKSGE